MKSMKKYSLEKYPGDEEKSDDHVRLGLEIIGDGVNPNGLFFCLFRV